MGDILLLSALRTPVGLLNGALGGLAASRLGANVVNQVLFRATVPNTSVSDVVMGCVLSSGQGQAPARQAAMYAGLVPAVRTCTVSKVCGSGLEAIMQSAHALSAGMGSMFIAGGMESMSQAPYLLPKARSGYRLGHQQVLDSIICDGLWDPYNNLHMGGCAEQCASRYGFSREQQDAYAVESYRRAQAAQAAGKFTDEIAPVEISDSKGNIQIVKDDEGPGRVNYDKIPLLKPVFEKNGTITAANASGLNDGAAAVLLATEETARAKGLRPIARIVAFGSHAHEPLWFTTAPVQACRNALQAAGWSIDDVDLWEVNEAFAVVPLAFMVEMGVPHEKINVHGGAIALGHPIGCSGARIVVTLLAALRDRGLKRGVATICIGGGEGLAVCVELL